MVMRLIAESDWTSRAHSLNLRANGKWHITARDLEKRFSSGRCNIRDKVIHGTGGICCRRRVGGEAPPDHVAEQSVCLLLIVGAFRSRALDAGDESRDGDGIRHTCEIDAGAPDGLLELYDFWLR